MNTKECYVIKAMLKLAKKYVEVEKMKVHGWLVNNILFCYEVDKYTRNESQGKQHFLQHKEKHGGSKEAHTDGSKSTGRKVGYAGAFIIWVIYTDLFSSMLTI